MENCRKFSNQVAEQSALNMQLEHNTVQMKEQVMYMQDDWKREQELVKSMEKDLKFKEDQLSRTQEANVGQGAMINNLEQQLK